ncbi:MAG: hypothetical protein J2P54_03450, partial [Bradyrhizobiaceae bacterium]|nr:hypothetical protein [Bradyrhizobiaceae bacterium]
HHPSKRKLLRAPLESRARPLRATRNIPLGTESERARAGVVVRPIGRVNENSVLIVRWILPRPTNPVLKSFRGLIGDVGAMKTVHHESGVPQMSEAAKNLIRIRPSPSSRL